MPETIAARKIENGELEPGEIPPYLLKTVIRRKPLDPEFVRRAIVISAFAVMGVVFLILSIMTFRGGLPWDHKYYTDIFLLAIACGCGPYAVYYLFDLRRVEGIDDRFPDFLRDLAESARGGMTLPRALAAASRGSYGRLTPEIQQMTAQVEWGVEFTEALQRFSERNKSPLVRRTVSLIQEARRAGGNVVDVLTAAADDAREIKQIVEQRNTQMRSYSAVIYITFLVFIAVVLVLQAQLVPAFARASKSAGGSVAVGGINFGDIDVAAYNTMFFHASIIQAITGGLVAGVLTRGHAIAGLQAIVVMLAVAEFSFRFLGGG